MRVRLLLAIISVGLSAGAATAGPLHEAAKKGDVPGIAAALDAGASVNEADKIAPALFHAVQQGHYDAAKLLLERGATVDIGSRVGLPITVAALKGDAQMLSLLLSHNADPNTAKGTQTLLHMVAENGCLQCVRLLVDAGADVNAIWAKGEPDENQAIRTPTHVARYYGHPELAEYLMQHGVVIPHPEPISEKLAAADVAKGAAFFEANCRSCHPATNRDEHDVGPNLWNVVGRERASTTFGRYSPTLTAWEGTWNYEDLGLFLAGPSLTVPGVFMEVRGAPDPDDRTNLIAYLRTLADTPEPLP